MGPPGARTVVAATWDELPAAANGVRALLRSGTAVVLRLTAPGAPDLRTVDELARLVLWARRCGACLCLDAGERLSDLAELTGLVCVLGPGVRSVQV
jgi:hypothetical protein